MDFGKQIENRGIGGANNIRQRLTIIFMIAITLVGVSVRIVHLFSYRSQWVDEIALSENILSSSVSIFGNGPVYHQMAPLGWLLVQKGLASMLTVDPDLLFRILPFIFSIASIYIFWKLCRANFNTLLSCIGVAVYSIIPAFVIQSADIKQYSADEFAGAAIPLLFLTVLKKPYIDKYHLIISSIIGILIIFFSFPCVILMAGFGFTTLFLHYRDENWGLISKITMVYASWLLIFAALYFFVYADWNATESISRYWDRGFMPFPPDTISDITWFPETTLAFLGYLYESTGSVLLLVLTIAGGIFFFTSNRYLFFATIASILVALVLAIEMYPFRERLLSYLGPLTILFAVGGLAYIYEAGQRGYAVMVIILIGVMALSLSEIGLRMKAPRPFEREDIKSVLQFVAENREAGDILYVYYGAIPGFWFYKDQYDLDGATVIEGRSPRNNWLYLIEDLSNLAGKGRVWFIASHITRDEYINLCKDFAEEHGEIKTWRNFRRAAVGLLHLPDRALSEEATFSTQKPALPYRAHHPMFNHRLTRPSKDP